VGTKGYFRGVTSQESATESSPQSIAAVMNEWNFHGVDRDNLTFISPPVLTLSFYKSVWPSVLVFKVDP